ncbi:MAG: CBS domain-containing protein [Candidatus Omnitrophota bacterium]
MKKIKDVMNKEVPLLRRDTAFSEVLKIFAGSTYNTLPVIDEKGRLIGLVNLKHVLPNLFLPKEEVELLEKLPFFADFFTGSSETIENLKNLLIVSDIMQEKALAITEESSLVKAVILMKERDVHQLIVIDKEDRPAGLVSYNDICRSLL